MRVTVDPKYNYALSQVFSPALVKNINDPSHEQNIRSLLEKCNLYPFSENWDLVRGLDITYDYLKQNYRCEYVYKNEIANQLLLKFHSNNSATLLKEVASDNSIADIIIVNGNTVAYEVKTELDNFDRLSGQLTSYQLLYDYVYIVTHPAAVDVLTKKVGKGIGIIVLEDNGNLSTHQPAESCTHKFNPAKAILTLRQSELVKAYKNYRGNFPPMGTALIYDYCSKWFINLNQEEAHAIFAEALKSRKPSQHQFKLIKNCNPALKMLFLGRELSKKYCSTALDRLGIFV